MNIYDLIIIGAGPAGLTASIYASRYHINHLIIGEITGGLATDAHRICNFPSEKEISGADLTAKMHEATVELGADIKAGRVNEIEIKDDIYTIFSNGDTYKTKSILLATGTKRRQLGLPEEKSFLGRGVSYCATCDGAFFKNKTVAILGGSDSANTASLHLAHIADKVYQIYRKDKLRGEPAWIEQVMNNDKIEIIFNNNVVGLSGNDKLEKIILENEYKNKKELEADGLFIEIGSQPDTDLTNKIGITTDNEGYIITDIEQKTNITGIWAAGDITTGSNKFRQIITASAEGAIAAESVFKWLSKK